jgi:hypothetical protein
VRLDAPEAEINKALARRQKWQDLAWGYFDEVPEVKQSTWLVGNAMGKLRLYPAAMEPDAEPDSKPVLASAPEAELPEGLARAAQEEIDRLRGEWGGTSSILRDANMNLETVGEGYVVFEGEREADPTRPDDQGKPEQVSFRSVDELRWKEGTAHLFDGPDDLQGRPLDPERGDEAFRVYQPHPRWSNLADCALRGALGTCEALVLYEKYVRGKPRRRANAGILTVSNDVSIGAHDPTSDEGGEEATADDFMKELGEGLAGPVGSEEHENGVVPLVMRGDPESLKPDVLRHITLDMSADDNVMQDIEALVRRLARGLNLPVEMVTGHSETTFTNAEFIDRDRWEDHFEPRAVLLVDAFTVGWLRPRLLDRGFDPAQVDRVFVWYDESALVKQPDPAEAADEGVKNGSISRAAWRRVRGFSEDDAQTPQETAELAEQRAAEQQRAVEQVATLIPALAAVMRPDTRPEAIHAGSTLVAARRPQRPDLGRRLLEVDRELRTRLLVLADDTLTRALELAGARLRTKAGAQLRGRLKDVEAWRVASVMGESLVAATGGDDLLAGAFDAMEASFMEWGATAQNQALDLASKVIGGFSRADRDRLGLRQAENLEEAWRWTREALSNVAEARLFDPNPVLEAFGEATGGRVPPGLIRQSLARAGGAVGLEATGEGGAFLALGNGGTEPVGGVATGEDVRSFLGEHGFAVEGYVWVYGPALRTRPFEPHLALDGVEFLNFDDPVLLNTDDFPDLPFYAPGDHAACACDAEPRLLPPLDL